MAEFLQLLSAVGWVALVSGVLVVGAAFARPRSPRSAGLSSLAPRIRVTWSAAELGLVVLLSVLVPSVVAAVLEAGHFWPWWFGQDIPDRLPELPKPLQTRAGLWLAVVAYPTMFVLALALFRFGSGTRPDQFGLSTQSLLPSLLRAWPVWLGCTVVVFPIHIGCNALFEWWVGNQPKQHPLMDLVQDGGPSRGAADIWLVFFQVMITAPFWEEFLCRGVIQPWLATRPWGPHVAMAVVTAAAITSIGTPAGFAPWVFALWLWAMLPLVDLAPESWWRWLLGRGPSEVNARTPANPRDVARAILATAAVFGMAHVGVWPTPVPLFVFGLGLGWLMQRTRNLAAPIAVHALFNAVSCVLLLNGM